MCIKERQAAQLTHNSEAGYRKSSENAAGIASKLTKHFRGVCVCEARASVDQIGTDDIKLQRRISAKTNYLHHRMCDDIFKEIKKKKKGDNKHIYTCTVVGSRINRHRWGSSPLRSFCVALAHRWLMQPIECNRCGQTKTGSPDEESLESVFAALMRQIYNSIYNIQPKAQKLVKVDSLHIFTLEIITILKKTLNWADLLWRFSLNLTYFYFLIPVECLANCTESLTSQSGDSPVTLRRGHVCVGHASTTVCLSLQHLSAGKL